MELLTNAIDQSRRNLLSTPCETRNAERSEVRNREGVIGPSSPRPVFDRPGVRYFELRKASRASGFASRRLGKKAERLTKCSFAFESKSHVHKFDVASESARGVAEQG